MFFEIDNNDILCTVSFNPLTKPYELCINCYKFKNNFSVLSKYVETIEFQVLLAHEICHYCQTQKYEVGYMNKHVELEKNGNYDSSIVELEACLFMLIEDMHLNNIKVSSPEDIFNYAEHTNNQFLNHASSLVLNNRPSVLNILENNKDFISESIQFSSKKYLR